MIIDNSGRVGIIENVQYFECSDTCFTKEYVFGIEIHPNEKVVFGGKEHPQFKW
jgi:hypothetical protein